MPGPNDAIERVLRDVIAPLIHADGGEVHLVSATGDSVAIHLSGRLAGCPGNTLAQRRVIEPALKAALPGVRLTLTSGALVPAGARPVR